MFQVDCRQLFPNPDTVRVAGYPPVTLTSSYNVWSAARLQEKKRMDESGLRQCIRPFVESVLLAMMSFARACSYNPNGREDHIYPRPSDGFISIGEIVGYASRYDGTVLVQRDLLSRMENLISLPSPGPARQASLVSIKKELSWAATAAQTGPVFTVFC